MGYIHTNSYEFMTFEGRMGVTGVLRGIDFFNDSFVWRRTDWKNEMNIIVMKSRRKKKCIKMYENIKLL